MGQVDVGWRLQALAFSVYAVSNIGLNYFNSWALRQAEVPGLGKGDFNFPFFYTMFHMVASAIACLLLLNCCGAAKEGAAPSFALLWEYKWQILPISICTVLGTALNNWSLTLVALFVNQVIKSCVPAVTCAFEFVWLRKIVSWKIYLLVLCICGGSVLTQVDNFDGASSTIVGIVVCAIAICAASARGVLQKAITSGTPGVEPLQPLVVLMWDASFSAVILFFMWVFSDERGRSIDYLLGRTGNELSGLLAAGIISFGSALAFTHNIANYYYIMWTSALTMAIGGNGIKILLLCVSAVSDGMTSPATIGGIALVVSASASYAYLQYQPKAQAAKEVPADGPKETTPLAAQQPPAAAKSSTAV